MSAILELAGVTRRFRQGGAVLDVLRGVDLTIAPGEIVALLGTSGAGKSTLLHIAGLLERPDGGRVNIDGVDCMRLGDDGRTRIRREYVGFVYQFHHLLPEFTALENIVLAQMIAGTKRAAARARAMTLLDQLGVGARARHRPAQLSGGEQQRVAIARALANQPRLLLADEPTGNLDRHTADKVLDALLVLVRQEGLAAVVATHNQEVAKRVDRTVVLDDGRLRAV